MPKTIRLVRTTTEDSELSSQAARDREARDWIERITTEQRVWDLRRMGFFEFGGEFTDLSGAAQRPPKLK
jgi:hypothetical protein